MIVLPPSETKSHGGHGAPLDLGKLSFPELNPVRQELIDALLSLSVDDALGTLGISEKLRPEAESNSALLSNPTMPAIQRYTGVLYDALDAGSLSDTSQIAIGSALFGVVRAADPIPHYRLSGATKLDGKTMRSRWGGLITDALSGDFVVDLRSGTYQNLGKVPGAVTVRVVSGQTRKVISHFNKHYKGEFARALAPHDATDMEDVVDIARAAGLHIECGNGTELTLVTP